MWCETVRRWENASSIATGYSEPAPWRRLSPAADGRVFHGALFSPTEIEFPGLAATHDEVYDRTQKCTYQVTFGVR
jgi:hypothetical protein